MTNMDIFNKLTDAIAFAKSLGATDVSISYTQKLKLAASVRLNKIESVEEAASSSYGFTIFVGQQKFSSSLSSTREKVLRNAIEHAVSTAKKSPVNPYAGLADLNQLAKNFPDLDLYDAVVPSAKTLIDAARAAEDAGLSAPRITNSEGADATHGQTESWSLATNGFQRHNRRSNNSLSVSLIAAENGRMETDYDSYSAVYLNDLESPQSIGARAALRAAAKLNACPPQTGQFPLVFDPRIGSNLLDSFSDAVWGAAVAKGSTYLKSAMGQRIFSKNVTILDDPFLKRGLGSQPCDSEGIPSRKLALVENGILQSWLLSLEPARQLDLQSTGHANGQTNLTIEPGPISPEDLIADIKDGFYVTGLMGHGANIINGIFSQGAHGLWIKDGKISEQAISEATIAGDLDQMFLNLIPANDLNRFKSTLAVPTLRIDGMMIGGG